MFSPMTQEEKSPIPMMIISDAPTAGSGLARITKDLATRIAIHLSDKFRVCTLGYGGQCSRNLPFHQYTIEGMQDWFIPTIMDTWKDWAGTEKGIVFSIWDLSRLGWLSQPSRSDQLRDKSELREFLINPPFKKWIYAPIDAEGPNSKLTFPLKPILYGFDRVITYSKWASGVIDRTMDVAEEDMPNTHFLPHGIDSEIFYERDREWCRNYFPVITESMSILGKAATPITREEVLIGIVATNQSRKDWHLGIETASILSKIKKVRLWIHTDALERNWSIPALLVDYGMIDKTIVSLGNLQDDKLAQAYSACDITLGIGLGEGFGFPIHESLFCGTPCIHGNYGGAPEWISGPYSHATESLVQPAAYRYEGLYSCKRPVFSVKDWADKAESLIGYRINHNGILDWKALWPEWSHWITQGI